MVFAFTKMRLIYLVALAVAVLNSGELLAQNLDQAESLRRPVERAEEPRTPTQGESLSDPENADVVLLDELKSIRLLTDEGVKGGAKAKAHVEKLIAKYVDPALEPYIGQPLTVSGLQEIKLIAQKIYDQRSSALIRVILPEQEISNGEVLLMVVAARVGKVDAAERRAQRLFRLQTGDVLDRQTVVDDLDWLSRPSRKTASVLLRSGENPGETDINLVVDKEGPWRLFSSWDNYGVEILGKDRWTFGAAHSDLFGRDIEVLYQYLSDGAFDALEAHFATAIIPISALQHEIRWLGYLADSAFPVDLGTGFGEFDLGGESWQSSLEYRVPLPRIFQRKVRHELVLGFDAKGANTNIEFGRIFPLKTNTEIYQFQIGYEADWRDSLGLTQLDFALVTSPGNWNSQNSDAAFSTARLGADSTYTYLNFGINRSIDLPGRFQLYAEVDAQASSANLLPSEQLSLSGPWAVRGFRPSEIRSDSGVISRFELRAPALSVVKRGDLWQAFGFTDFAWGENDEPIFNERSIGLGSAGLGLRANIRKNLSTDLNYAWQIREQGFDDGEQGRFQARVSVFW